MVEKPKNSNPDKQPPKNYTLWVCLIGLVSAGSFAIAWWFSEYNSDSSRALNQFDPNPSVVGTWPPSYRKTTITPGNPSQTETAIYDRDGLRDSVVIERDRNTLKPNYKDVGNEDGEPLIFTLGKNKIIVQNSNHGVVGDSANANFLNVEIPMPAPTPSGNKLFQPATRAEKIYEGLPPLEPVEKKNILDLLSPKKDFPYSKNARLPIRGDGWILDVILDNHTSRPQAMSVAFTRRNIDTELVGDIIEFIHTRPDLAGISAFIDKTRKNKGLKIWQSSRLPRTSNPIPTL